MHNDMLLQGPFEVSCHTMHNHTHAHSRGGASARKMSIPRWSSTVLLNIRHDGATSPVVCAPPSPPPSSSYTYLYSVDMLAQGIKVPFHLLGQNTLKLPQVVSSCSRQYHGGKVGVTELSRFVIH